MVGAMQRQEDQIAKLQQLVAQQASAQAEVERSEPPVVAPVVTEGVATATVPIAARTVPTTVATGSGTTNPDGAALEAERERALAALMMFRKFDPPTFDGEKVEPWMVESWIDSMETLFEDLYTLERDKVHLATRCLVRTTKVWWKRIKRDRSPDLPPLSWEKFRSLVYTTYFPDNEKKKLQEQFRKLEQGNRSIGEYEREFSHIIDCVPDVVWDVKDRADWFERGLRQDIYRAVHILKLTTYAEVLDRALWAEHGNAHIREKQEASEKEGGKKRA
ncbi:uncharacterized protein LOC109725584 [Ananas comosus]|uniref:Uncharacterized protein LOC109725584 n=1 Tax=Ananas comosus TaxID=4615 RepID=A0A6P5GR80_ANACO|nr:uncharacterized protein LOC109725584 [Ananas comosus]